MATCSVYALDSDLSDANIFGHVVDADSKDHIPYATIRIVGTTIGVSTDISGHYFLKNLENGDVEVEASCIGYIPQRLKAKIRKDKTLELNFNLREDVLQLEQVVVTGNRNEVKRRNTSSLINILGSQTLEIVTATSVADGLSYQPGVRVENNCQNCGFSQVRINGLDGHYSQILMNSRPVFSALTGVYGLEQIPANMIERIEVMRGGGSALFGSSAIGGTINIITKDPIVNGGEVSNTTTLIGCTGAVDNNTTFNASLVNDNNKMGLFIFGQYRSRDGYDDDDDGFTELTKLKTQTIGTRAFFRTSDISKLTLEYRGTHEYRRGGDNIQKPAHEAMIAEQADHSINGGDINFNIWSSDYSNKFNIFTSLQDTRRDSYYGSGKDPNAYGRTHDFVVMGGAQYTRTWKKLLFMPAELVAGVEYTHNYLNDIIDGYDRDVTQKTDVYSGYLQNEWRNDMWGFLVGAHLDKHSMISNVIVSPRVNVRYNPTKDVNFRATFSTGFRAPQIYDEDLHVDIAGGERIVTVLASDLKEERSNSFSVSGDFYHTFGSVQANFLIEGFYTTLNDVFAFRELEEKDEFGNSVLERYNGSDATVMGLTLEGKLAFTKNFTFQAGMTMQRSRYKEAESWSEDPNVAPTKHMFRTPDMYGYITAKYSPIKPLSFSLSGTFTGPMYVQHLVGSGTDIDEIVRTPTFADINLKASYDFKLFNYATMELSAGVMNIFNSYQSDFDKGKMRDAGYVYGPMHPRSIIFGAKISL